MSPMAHSPLRKFLRLSAGDRSLLLHSVLLVGAARLALWVLPFNVVRRLLSRRARRSPVPSATTERIGWAISVATRFVPNGNCLPQALAAESLLTRSGHPVELRIGVAKTDQGRLEAHAWVESGGRLIVGDLTQGLDTYTPLPPLPGVGR
jgi:hypothetical protein